MRSIGYLILAEEMLRRSSARGIEVRFIDKDNQEVLIRINRDRKVEKENEGMGKRRSV